MHIDPVTTYVHLGDGGGPARVLPLTPDFWSSIGERRELHVGRLVSAFEFSEDWPAWETHPQGDELVMLLSGALDLVLDRDGTHEVVPLRGRAMCIVPQGVWHTANVVEPATTLHITWGGGTEHRPR